jgi:hypothetical protein
MKASRRAAAPNGRPQPIMTGTANLDKGARNINAPGPLPAL